MADIPECKRGCRHVLEISNIQFIHLLPSLCKFGEFMFNVPSTAKFILRWGYSFESHPIEWMSWGSSLEPLSRRQVVYPLHHGCSDASLVKIHPSVEVCRRYSADKKLWRLMISLCIYIHIASCLH